MDIKKIYTSGMKTLGQTVVEAPWKDATFYASWLAQTYYFVKDNTRLLMLCGSRVSLQDQKLHIRLIEHASEEKGHEMLLVRDLNKLGRKVEEIPQFSSTAGFYQSQYYWIEHCHPIAFFGYIILLEGLGAEYAPKVGKMAGEAHGAAATSFLRVHGEEDTSHIESAFKELAALPSEHIAMVAENFRLALGFYEAIVKDCIAYSKQAKAA